MKRDITFRAGTIPGKTTLLLWVCTLPLTGLAQPPQSPPPPVLIETISLQPVNTPQEFLAQVEAIEAVDLQARVNGALQQVMFEASQHVTEGQPLFQIAPEQYEAALAVAQAGVAQAEAAHNNAQRLLARNRGLTQQQAVSAAAMDEVAAAAEIATANLSAAQAQLQLAELDLSYTRIEAPIAGEIGQPLFTRGNLVGPNSGPLARLVQLDPIRVVFTVAEGELITLRQQSGQAGEIDPDSLTLTLRLPNGTNYGPSGHIEYVANEVDPRTATVAVRATFPNPDQLLVPNQTVILSIQEEAGAEQPVVPQTAVLQDQEGRFVFVLGADDTVTRRPITTGERVRNGWAVQEGLAGGERVVVQGTQRLSEGMQVNPSQRIGADTTP